MHIKANDFTINYVNRLVSLFKHIPCTFWRTNSMWNNLLLLHILLNTISAVIKRIEEKFNICKYSIDLLKCDIVTLKVHLFDLFLRNRKFNNLKFNINIILDDVQKYEFSDNVIMLIYILVSQKEKDRRKSPMQEHQNRMSKTNLHGSSTSSRPVLQSMPGTEWQ